MKILFLIILVAFYSCKNQGGSGGGGGGGTPTADDLNNYIDRLTSPEDKTCGDLRTDNHISSKYPIVYPSGKMTWKNEYSEALDEQFSKDYMRPLRMQKINENDLNLIGCPGYNNATDEEKKKFWILFMSSVSKPESGFDPDEEYRETDGTTSTGMLQIDPKSGNRWCGILSKEMNQSGFGMKDMHNPITNLKCGLLMMQWQVLGVPMGKGLKQTRPDLEGRLFTDNTFWYWSVLSNKNGNGKRKVIDWFRVHAQRQLKFCNRTNPIDGYTPGLSYKYKGLDCSKMKTLSEKELCEKYYINQKIEDEIFDPRVGENKEANSCGTIDNGSRANTKELFIEKTDSGINTISK
jgi:hypothetical protein